MLCNAFLDISVSFLHFVVEERTNDFLETTINILTELCNSEKFL
jgi:hypothetical protein